MKAESAGAILRAGFAFAIVVAVLGSSSAVGAQPRTGTLYGKVTSTDGLAVPGVTITVTSPQLISAQELAVTTESGEYRVPLLPSGAYAITAQLSGFQTVTREAIVLETGAVLGINFTLSASTVEERVTVVGGAPIIDVKSPQTTRTIDQATLESIPVGRNFADLIKTMSGVTDGEYNFAPVQAVQGSSVRDNVYNVDGAGANDTTVGYMTTEIPYDMIEEVQVVTGGISAEFSQGGAAVFNFVTKSGGNSFAGGASFYGEGSALSGSNLDDELRAQGITQGTEAIKNLEYGGQLGGPIVKDRLWFFGNVRWLTFEQAQPDFPENKAIDQRQSFAKVTGQITSRLRAYGSFTEGTFKEWVDQGDFTMAAAPETWREQNRHQRIIHFGGTQTVGTNTVAEARFSRSFKGFDPQFPNNPEGKSGYMDVTTGLVYGGHVRPDRLRRKMDQGQFNASISHFRTGWLGDHEMKAGLLLENDPYEQSEVFYDGQDLLYLVRNRQPYRVRLYNTPVTVQASNVTLYAGYLQDQWSLTDQLTVSAGVRYETAEGWTPEQEYGGGRWVERTTVPERRDLVNLSSWSPRLGVVWALGSARRSSIRVSYGRYYNPLLVGHVTNSIVSDYQEFDWLDRNGDNLFQVGEAGTLRRAFASTAATPPNPDLRAPFIDGLHLGTEWQLGSKFGLSVTGIFKRERDILENVDIGRPFSAYLPVTVTNPLDHQPMTIYTLDPAYQSVPSRRILSNPSDPVPLKRDYRGVEIVLRRRLSEGWQFQGSLNLGRSEGNVGTSFGYSAGTSATYDTPNSLINADGPLDLDSPVQIKLQGSYMAPYKILVSALYSGLSGYPIHPPENFPNDPALGAYTVRFTSADNPAIIVEPSILVAGVPRGTYRQDFRNKLSVRVEKQVQLGKTRLGLMADVFNLFNINTVTAVQTLKTDLPNFLAPSRIEPPRSVRLGVRLDF